MKILINILKCIFNPFYMIVTANEENKPLLKHIKRTDVLLLVFAFIVTAIIILIFYHKSIFGV